jgi:hypothetical protein
MDELALRTLVTNLEASRSSDHWWLEVCTALVAVGVLFEVIFVIWEYVDELHDFRRGIVHPPERPNIILFALGLLGAALVAIGVAGEFRFEAKIESTETRIRKANDDLFLLLSKEAGDAAISAKTARDEADAVKGIADEARSDAKDALAKAQAAQRELAHAESDAAKAQTAASKALSTADKAESHLADAMKRADALTVQLNRLTTPRSLPHTPDVVSPLKPFKGMEYMFADVCSDTECIQLLRDIESVLQLAEWKRVKAPHTFPGLLLWDSHDQTDGVGISLEPGIMVSVDSVRQFKTDEEIANLPQHVRAAIALNLTLRSDVSPPENTNRLVTLTSGPSTIVRISVGRKPLP